MKSEKRVRTLLEHSEIFLKLMNESINLQQSLPRTAHTPLKMIYSCFNALGQN